MEKTHNGYTGLADLSDKFGNRIDLNEFAKRTGLTDGQGNKTKLEPLASNEPKPVQETKVLPKIEPKAEPKAVPELVVKNSLPEAFVGKNFDQLYQSDDLENVRVNHPEHYEKLKAERFKKID